MKINMDKEKIVQISKIVEDEMENEQENKLLDDLRERFQKLKLNLATRKRIAKSLSIDEKKARNWETVGDVFSFLDTSTLAKEHPEEASRILKVIAGIVGVAFPITLPVTGTIILLPSTVAAKLMEYLGKPTPEYVIHKIADYQAEKFNAALLEASDEISGELPEYIDVEEIEIDVADEEEEADDVISDDIEEPESEQEDAEEEPSEPVEEIRIKQDDSEVIDSIELLYTLCQRGILTEEEFNSKKEELLKKLG